MAEPKDIKTEKETFMGKVTDATDEQIEDGYAILKKQYRVACEKLQADKEKVEQLLQNPVYLKALDDVESSKLAVSILSWKIGKVVEEQAKRFRELDEKDGDF